MSLNVSFFCIFEWRFPIVRKLFQPSYIYCFSKFIVSSGLFCLRFSDNRSLAHTNHYIQSNKKLVIVNTSLLLFLKTISILFISHTLSQIMYVILHNYTNKNHVVFWLIHTIVNNSIVQLKGHYNIRTVNRPRCEDQLVTG